MFPKSLEVQMMHENAGDFLVYCGRHYRCKIWRNVAAQKKSGALPKGKKRRILNLTDGSENPVGEWNNMVIECVNDEIKVWVNGELVNHGYNCTATKGQIAVQAEGSEVEFRKLELTPISKITDSEESE